MINEVGLVRPSFWAWAFIVDFLLLFKNSLTNSYSASMIEEDYVYPITLVEISALELAAG